MKKDKVKNLEKKGWKIGTVSEFLDLPVKRKNISR
jgi:hypothetical protein